MDEKPKRRASDQAFVHRMWATLKEQPILTLLLVAVGLQALMLSLGLFVLNPRASDNERRIEALARSNGVLIRETSHASLEQCRRGNVSRPQQVRVYEAISDGNKSRAVGEFRSVEAWQATAASFPAVSEVAAMHITVAQAKRRAALVEATALHHAAVTIANAQKAVAKHPGAQSLVKRSIVDCESQFG